MMLRHVRRRTHRRGILSEAASKQALGPPSQANGSLEGVMDAEAPKSHDGALVVTRGDGLSGTAGTTTSPLTGQARWRVSR
jgi:hypothetical protein